MTKAKVAAKCGAPYGTKIEDSCQSTSCGGDDFSNYNPMKLVIA